MANQQDDPASVSACTQVDYGDLGAAIVLGRAGYGAAAGAEVMRCVAALEETRRWTTVISAFVDQGAPSLPVALDRCVESGVKRVVVVPAWVPSDEALHAWIGGRLRSWLRNHEEHGVAILLADPVGSSAPFASAVCEMALQAIESTPELRSTDIARVDPSWSVIPRHQHHVLLCRGPRCTERGANEIMTRLTERLRERGLDRGPGQVLLVTTGCQYPCNLGPMMIVYPERVWYCAVTPRIIDRIVDEHFEQGHVVLSHARAPSRGRQRRPDTAVDTVPPNPSS